MRSKRLLAMLLVLCLVVSAMAPAASAVKVTGNTEQKTNVSTDASSKENNKVISGKTDDEEKGLLHLRDNLIIRNEIAKNTGKGSWGFAAAEAPEESLLLSETPDCIKELKKAAEVFAQDEIVRAFVVMEEAPLAESTANRAMASAALEKQLLKKQKKVCRLLQ